MQAEADKEGEEESEIAAASAELQPGERKVISDGTQGPVVEIIRKTDAEQPFEVDETEATVDEDSKTKKPIDQIDTEAAGE